MQKNTYTRLINWLKKAHNLKTSQAKRSEFGDCSKYVTFILTDKKGNKEDGKIKVKINEEAIEKAKILQDII